MSLNKQMRPNQFTRKNGSKSEQSKNFIFGSLRRKNRPLCVVGVNTSAPCRVCCGLGHELKHPYAFQIIFRLKINLIISLYGSSHVAFIPIHWARSSASAARYASC